MEQTQTLINQLGERLHQQYVEHQSRLGESSDSNPCLVGFHELPKHLQKSNRETAAQLWQLLKVAGLEIVPADAPRIPLSDTEYLNQLELLSEICHCRWINNRLQQGWTFDPGPKNTDQRTSPCLIAWHQLPREEQEKVEAQLRAVPDFLRELGHKITRSRRLMPGWRFYEDPLELLREESTAVEETVMDDGILTQPSHQLLNAIARAMHRRYLEHRTATGETAGPQSSLQSWDELDPVLQQSNQIAASQVWQRMAAVGYVITPADSELPVVSPDEFEQHVEVLARLEHTAWMNERLESGWSYAPGEKSLEQRTHPYLVSWEQLPEAEKEKDRQQMRAVPAILAEAGLKLALQPSTTPLMAEYVPSLG
ncbi:MAG: hypothetical protein GEEBNDBF_00637 [bacterium]|nr:hypothetical protein [bacterium]